MAGMQGIQGAQPTPLFLRLHFAIEGVLTCVGIAAQVFSDLAPVVHARVVGTQCYAFVRFQSPGDADHVMQVWLPPETLLRLFCGSRMVFRLTSAYVNNMHVLFQRARG
jgi:hypothetical protein